MFENKKTEKQGIRYSRYIASWINVGGERFDTEFMDWLKSEGCTQREIIDIRQLAECGKFELELSAKKFITNTV